MPQMPAHSASRMDIAPEELLRARMYRLLATFLSAPPDQPLLTKVAALRGGRGALGEAIDVLARVCARTAPASAAEEYHDLFIGLGRGELVPFASYYLTGFLHEKPLARLRQDMARLGIVRRAGISEPEDHVASVLEMAAGLVDGELGRASAAIEPVGLDVQRAFFKAHIAPWAGVFFRDLEAAKAAVLYGALGSVGRAFLDIEDKAYVLA
jgi:TorA maturation chaperone TorD